MYGRGGSETRTKAQTGNGVKICGKKWSRVRPAEIDSTWELKIQYTNEILIEFSFL
jgi:hypothetical protein